MKTFFVLLLISVLLPAYAGTGFASDAVWGIAFVIGIILLFPGIAYGCSWLKDFIHHRKNRRTEEWLEAE